LQGIAYTHSKLNSSYLSVSCIAKLVGGILHIWVYTNRFMGWGQAKNTVFLKLRN
jgi:hypothetical protein